MGYKYVVESPVFSLLKMPQPPCNPAGRLCYRCLIAPHDGPLPCYQPKADTSTWWSKTLPIRPTLRRQEAFTEKDEKAPNDKVKGAEHNLGKEEGSHARDGI